MAVFAGLCVVTWPLFSQITWLLKTPRVGKARCFRLDVVKGKVAEEGFGSVSDYMRYLALG